MPEPHNGHLLRLLFIFAHWHGLAKLRQHTDLSLDVLDVTTTQLGKALRDFAENTCPAFDTRELKREAEARQRREAKGTSSNTISPPVSAPSAGPSATSSTTLSGPAHPPPPASDAAVTEPPSAVELPTATTPCNAGPSASNAMPSQSADSALPPSGSTSVPTGPLKQPTGSVHKATTGGKKDGKKPTERLTGRRRKAFNLNTYKSHSLGDYVETIRTYGTTDSYTTEIVGVFFFFFDLPPLKVCISPAAISRSWSTEPQNHVTSGQVGRSLKNS